MGLALNSQKSTSPASLVLLLKMYTTTWVFFISYRKQMLDALITSYISEPHMQDFRPYFCY